MKVARRLVRLAMTRNVEFEQLFGGRNFPIGLYSNEVTMTQLVDLGDVQKRRIDSSDHSLLKRYVVGEQDAATELYLRYSDRLQAWASSQTSSALSTRFDEEDVIQSVFRTFFRRVSEGLYDVPPGDELWQLLLVIALNKVRKLATFHRAQKRDIRKSRDADLLDISGQLRTRDETSLKVLEMVIEELLTGRTPTQQSIVRLRIDGHQINDISQQTQQSKRTVERVLRDFRLQLSTHIDVGTNPS